MTVTRRLTYATFAIATSMAACKGTPADTPSADPPPVVSVTVAPIVRMTMHAYVEGWGRVEPEPAGEGRPAASARVTSPVAGAVTQVLSSDGQRVAQGATLFRLDGRVADVAVERLSQIFASDLELPGVLGDVHDVGQANHSARGGPDRQLAQIRLPG